MTLINMCGQCPYGYHKTNTEFNYDSIYPNLIKAETKLKTEQTPSIQEVIKTARQFELFTHEERMMFLVEAKILDEDGLPNEFFEEWRKEALKSTGAHK